MDYFTNKRKKTRRSCLTAGKYAYLCAVMKKQKEGFGGERILVLPPMVVQREREDALVSSLYITDIGYYPHATNHYRERTAPIGQHVLIYCVNGRGWFSIGGGERCAVEQNQFFILPAGKPHSYGSSDAEPWTIYWVHFGGEHADVYAADAQKPQTISPAVNSRISDRNNIFEEIFLTLEGGYDIERLRYTSSLFHHYLATIRYVRQFRDAEQKAQAGGDADVVGYAIHYMRERLEQRITLAELSQFTGYSASHFSAVFRSATGHSPLNYFNLLKVETACRYLEQTDMKVNQICHKVGIEDSYYFSRLFSKVMGMSPSEYRKKMKNEE